MTGQLPAIVVVAPLVGALLAAAAGWLRRWLCFPLALASLAAAAAASVGVLAQVVTRGPILYRLAGWDPPWGIVFSIDALNAVVLCVVTLSAAVNLVASRETIERGPGFRVGPFYSLYVLSVTGLAGMVLTGDLFNLYVLLEITSLSGYALVAVGRDRANLSALNYLLMGTIGASFYLLGVGFLYTLTGSLNMADIAARLPELYGSPSLFIAFALMLVGLWLKAALFPLHAWLPNAYTYANSAASGLLAPLMTKVMIYVMLRVMVTVFTPAYVFRFSGLAPAVVWLAVIAIVAGAVLALAAKDLKRMLTYIIVAEVGYMVGGAWLGNADGFTGAVLHLVNDAVMTLCLFLAAGAIARRTGGTGFESLQGLFRTMPFTMAGLVVGGLAIIGVPPTGGFFSKWYLISAGIQAGQWGYVAALVFSSLVAVVLFFRVFEIAYFQPWAEHGEGHGGQGGHGHAAAPAMHEAPLSMVAPLMAAAAGVIALGLFTGPLAGGIIRLALPLGLG
jgi:multicomponent Na+:H+ antiporter subunit D